MEVSMSEPVWVEAIYRVVQNISVTIPTLRISEIDLPPASIGTGEPVEGGGVVSSHHVIQPALRVPLVTRKLPRVAAALRLDREFLAERHVVVLTDDAPVVAR